MTRTNREPFHVCSGMCTDLCVSPVVFGRQGTIVDRDVSDTCVSREIFFSPPHLPLTAVHLYNMLQMFLQIFPFFSFHSTFCHSEATRYTSRCIMTTPHVSVAITVSLQVSNEPVYTTVTSSSVPAETSQTPVTPNFVYTTPTGRCVHRASCKHLKAFTKAMHICSCVMQECGPSTRMYADDDDRLHVHTCSQAICRGKAYSKCRDCWIAR